MNTLTDYLTGLMENMEPKKLKTNQDKLSLYKCNETGDVKTVAELAQQYDTTVSAIRYRLNCGKLNNLTFTKV